MKLKHLMFSRRYLPKLLSGEKRVTIRAKRINLKKGDIALVHSMGLILGKVRILSVTAKRLCDLSESEAAEDGFSSVEELKKALKEHYPYLRDDSFVYVVRFDWIETYSPPLSERESTWPYKLTPKEVALIALSSGVELNEDEREILRSVAEAGSIRKAAVKLGSLSLRPLVREVLHRTAAKLEAKGLISRNS